MYSVKIKIKYAHLVELSAWIQTKKQNLIILKIHLITNLIISMLQTIKEAKKPLATSIVQPMLHGMIKYLAPNVLVTTAWWF